MFHVDTMLNVAADASTPIKANEDCACIAQPTSCGLIAASGTGGVVTGFSDVPGGFRHIARSSITTSASVAATNAPDEGIASQASDSLAAVLFPSAGSRNAASSQYAE